MQFEQKQTADGVEIRVTAYVPKPQIDISHWPKFTVEWMGSRMQGRVLAAGVYQLGSVVVFRNDEGDYVELAPSVYAQSLKGKGK